MTKPKAPSKYDVDKLKDFLLWAQENEIQLHQVDFGTIKVTVTDLEVLGMNETANPFTDDSSYSQLEPEPAEPQNIYDQMLRARGITPAKESNGT